MFWLANCGCVFSRCQKPCSHSWFCRHLYATRFEPRGSRSRNHGRPIYTHIPNVIAMFSYWCFGLFSPKSQNENAPLATRDAPRRSRSRNIAVRNVCRAPFRDQFSCVIATFEIRDVFQHVWHARPPDPSVRSFWCASCV